MTTHLEIVFILLLYMRLIQNDVLHTKDGKPCRVESEFLCSTSKGLMIEILFATTYHKDLVRAMMVAVGRATE